VYDTVVVIVGTDNDSVRRIPVKSYTPPVDSVDFFVRMPAQLTAGHIFSADVLPDRAVSAGKNLISISGRLRFPDNDFEFDSVTVATGGTPALQLKTIGPSRANGITTVDFSVSNPSGILLDPAVPIVQLLLEPVLTDTIDYSVQLDSVLLNGGDSQYSNCTLATSGAGTFGQLSSSCGDSLLIEVLRGHPLFFATLPDPNPVGLTDGDGISHFMLKGNVKGEAVVELFDDLGRAISHQRFSLQAGETLPCSFDLRALPAGSYFYSIRYTSNDGISTSKGSILVVH
ncbi:MAG TPA: T9SS type A sorting domain-containing protein, partial [Candidatus Kapabacteria bacterium]|nr:T9SS type A sorting domain-containing protein [Candidatus Kapabacteria bacterium]